MGNVRTRNNIKTENQSVVCVGVHQGETITQNKKEMNMQSEITTAEKTAKHVKPSQMADILGVKTRTVLNYAYSGQIPYMRIGKSIFFNPDEVIEHVKRNTESKQV